MPRVVKMAAAAPPPGLGGLPAGAAATGAAPPISVDDRYLYGSYGLVAAGAFLGCILLWAVDPSTTFTPADGFTALAPFYILAQSVERLVEPLTNLDAFGKAADAGNGGGGGDADVTGHLAANPAGNLTKKAALAARDLALKALANATADESDAKADDAAQAQAQVDRIRRNRALLGWGIASFLGIVVCGLFGLQLIALTGMHVNKYVDVVITGIAVGSGTKPLHDLISNIQKSKDGKADQPATT
jgi:hypothetical protein